jgi:cytochrome c oxidase cbb3-type subunit 3
MWWVGLFILTIVFAVGTSPIRAGFVCRVEVGTRSGTNQVAKAPGTGAAVHAQFGRARRSWPGASAMAIGALFMNNCSRCRLGCARRQGLQPGRCHWLPGGSGESGDHHRGRIGTIPPYCRGRHPDDVRNVAHYVLSLSNNPHDSLRAQLGKSKFAACAACHGLDGKGNQALGTPNLADDIWLHGWGEQTIVAMINNGKTNEMPAQADKLTAAQIHVLTAYVW